MAQIFYDHLIDWEKLTQTLDNFDLEGEDRLELIEIVEQRLHTEVLVIILSSIPQHRHEEFIERFHAMPHDANHFEFLHAHASTPIEPAIRKRSSEIIEEFILDALSS